LGISRSGYFLKAIRAYRYTTNHLERLIKELKRWTKAVEVFCGPEALEKCRRTKDSRRKYSWEAAMPLDTLNEALLHMDTLGKDKQGQNSI